jgi:hypothetical protein
MPAVATIASTTRVLLGLACLLLGACNSLPSAPVPPRSPAATFVLVPHAETVDDLQDDPPLSGAGQQRAQALKDQLAGTMLVAVYADEFRRTQDTAAPTLAARSGLALQRYFSRGPLRETARQWRSRFTQGTVLVVGQPEAIAPLADALCDCTVTPLRAGESDRLVRIEPAAGERMRIDDGHYGNPSP